MKLIVGIIFWCLVGLFLIGLFAGDKDKQGNVIKNKHPDRSLAQVMAHSLVEKFLKSPSTAKFQSFPKVRYESARNLYSVIGEVDSQNSFGAMLRSKYVVIFQPICDDVYSLGCWQVFSLGIGDQVLVNRELPKLESGKPPIKLSEKKVRIILIAKVIFLLSKMPLQLTDMTLVM